MEVEGSFAFRIFRCDANSPVYANRSKRNGNTTSSRLQQASPGPEQQAWPALSSLRRNLRGRRRRTMSGTSQTDFSWSNSSKQRLFHSTLRCALTSGRPPVDEGYSTNSDALRQLYIPRFGKIFGKISALDCGEKFIPHTGSVR